MAQDQRSPGKHIVDAAIPVDVVEVGPLPAFDEGRLAAHRPEGPHWRIDSAWNQLQRLLHKLPRSRNLHARMASQMLNSDRAVEARAKKAKASLAAR